MNIKKTIAPLIIMVLANAAYLYHERRISKENEKNENRKKSEIEIVDVVLRWEIKKHSVTFKEKDGTACISVLLGLDLDKNFLERFSDLKIRIKDKDACDSDSKTGVIDRETRKHSVQIFVSGVRWENGNSVVVSSGYHEGNLGGSSGKVFLVFTGKKWEIVKEELEMVSQIVIPGKSPLKYLHNKSMNKDHINWWRAV